MATRKRWSRTVGTRRGNRIRIYQRAASGNLQMAVWKKRRKWVVPMPKIAKAALLKFRADNPAIGSALVFPMTNDPTKPVTRHLASDWMHRAYRYAGIDRQKGGLWHPFGRKWATARKDYPLRDTMAAGGWEDEPTAMKYQQPDEATLRELIDNPKPLKKRSQNS